LKSKIEIKITHGKNDFAVGFKILMAIDQKIILLNHQNNFVGILKIMSNAAKNVIATKIILYNYFDCLTKLFF